MTETEIHALKQGDVLYRVNRWHDMDGCERFQVVEFTFAAKKVTENQVKTGMATIPLTEAPRGVVKRVTFSMLFGFYKSSMAAVDAFAQRLDEDEKRERAIFERAEKARLHARKWASDWDGTVVRMKP